jgi:hypothetical protein
MLFNILYYCKYVNYFELKRLEKEKPPDDESGGFSALCEKKKSPSPRRPQALFFFRKDARLRVRMVIFSPL